MRDNNVHKINLILYFFVISIFTISCLNTSVNKKNDFNKAAKKIKVVVYSSVQNKNIKLKLIDSLQFKDFKQPLETEISIVVDSTKKFQTFLGIGAALTDASAITFYKLSKSNQQKFIKAYFDPKEGIGYKLARTTIHSCDFSSESYTYIKEGDTSLNSFNIKHDKKYRIPFIKEILKASKNKLTIYASPWSPPAFMKTNNSMLQGGKLKPEFYEPWANYYVKFINAYENEGIPIWGLTIQNESMAVQRWESCIYTAEDERDFLKKYLGPTLKKAGLANKKIIVWDHNRDLMFQRVNVIFNDPEAAKYAWGTGFHWYEDWKDGKPMFDNVERVNEAYPSKNLLFTEGCNERFDTERINSVALAERYGSSMIHDFNNGAVGWTDWNILLDETGGPNHVGNLCFAPVHGNTKTDDLLFTNSYYYIGHFSKFILPKAKRISSVSSSNNILTTAFENTDKSIVIVAMNKSDMEQSYTLSLGSSSAIENIQPHSIQTVIINHN